MLAYPVGPLLRSLAERILANLEHIERDAPKWGEPDQDRSPYPDTQLLTSLLGVLVFPNHRTPEALGELIKGYPELSQIVIVRYPVNGAGPVELVGADGERECIDPKTVEGLPRLLRNSIAHFNIRPLESNGRFSGVRVWNEDDDSRITFVADVRFEHLRSLAKHILKTLAEGRRDLKLKDPPDPLETLRRQSKETIRRRRAPRLTDSIWEKWVAAHGGDYDRAKAAIDRCLRDAVRDPAAQGSSKAAQP
jgi:HEPN pEK499 p136